MSFFVETAARSGSQDQALHLSLYAVLVIAGGVLLWAIKQFFGGLIAKLGGKSADSLSTNFFHRGRIAGGRLRKYQRAVQRNYMGHALGFGNTEIIDIRAVYVPLRYEEAGRREDLYAKIRDERRSVIVGPAGAGKSLLLKNSMLLWADGSRMRLGRRGDRRIPVLVELHRCNNSDADIVELMLDELARNQVKRSKSFVERALRDGRLRLLLDGLDEVGKDVQERVVKMIKDFAMANPECQIVVTCRDAIYYGQLSPEFKHVVRIAEFDDASIRRLLGNWPGIDRQDVDNLIGALRSNLQLLHLARSPLLLTMIAYLYVNRFAKSGRSLPGSRVTFYETAITHLLGRDQVLARATALSAFDTGDKLAALQRIAVAMQQSAADSVIDRKEISQVAAIAATRSVLPDLNLEERNSKPLFMEIVDRSQLLISLDQQRSHYSFRHLTLQEFLAARELADRPEELLRSYRNDPDGWREVVKLWCGVTTRNCTIVIREILDYGSLRQQVLALECLAEAKYVDDKFAHEVINHFFNMFGAENGTSQVLVAGFGALAAAEGPRGRNVLQRLIDLTPQGVDEEIRRAAFAALCASGRQEAAEVLANLAPYNEHARAALRTMGELAIPVLENRAAGGDLQAVDDLSFIGTPAAAESLAGLTCINAETNNSTIAVTAAWRLAQLLTVADVEEGLKNCRFQIPDGVSSHDWVWAPFALPENQDGPIGRIIGRAAFLIDSNPTFVPPVTYEIDQRIAIPLAGIKAGACAKALGWKTINKAANNMSDFQAQNHFKSESHEQSPQDVKLCDSILRTLRLPEAHEELSRGLPWPVLARLLAALFTERIKTTTARDWLEVQQNPESASRLWTIFGTVLGIIVTSAVVFASFWQIEVWRGVAKFGPSWLYIISFALFTASFVVFLITVFPASNTEEETIFDTAAIIGMVGAVLGALVDIVLSAVVLSRWYEPVIVGSTFAVVCAGIVLLCWLAIRQDRRYGNPLRHCLQASDRSFADRTSVIAK